MLFAYWYYCNQESLSLSLYRFIALSLYRFIALSLYRFIDLSFLPTIRR